MPFEHTCTGCGAIIPCRRILKPLDERFWSKVRKTDGCWLWVGAHDDNGYGRLGKPYGADGPSYVPAHRLSWILNRGPIPPGAHILHRCDVRECVRPEHLFLGTQAINMADKVAKGRQARGRTAAWARYPELAKAARASQLRHRRRRRDSAGLLGS
jgi:hypothetical protein